MKRNVTLRCRLGWHAWQNTNYPATQYPGISTFAGTKRCHRCWAFRYWTPAEEGAYFRRVPNA